MNDTDVFELQFACRRLGAIFLPLNWRLAVPELEFICNDAAPVVLIHGEEFADASAMGIDPVSPTGSSTGAEGELPQDEAPEAEGDRADEEEDIHDLALAAEGSGRSTHGHEVTFPPSDDDQGETIRIVTEAVELGEDEPAGPGSPHEPEAPSRPTASAIVFCAVTAFCVRFAMIRSTVTES